MKGEEAYRKLQLVKALDQTNQIHTDVQTKSSSVVIDHNLHKIILKEIMQNGGAPNFGEIMSYAEKSKCSQRVTDYLKQGSVEEGYLVVKSLKS